MRYDMLGAAAVLGLFEALDKQDKLPWNVIGVMGLAENMPGSNAQRPGERRQGYQDTRGCAAFYKAQS